MEIFAVGSGREYKLINSNLLKLRNSYGALPHPLGSGVSVSM